LAGKGKKLFTPCAHELLEIVGLADRQDHLPDELSRGEQQRMAMVGALALGRSRKLLLLSYNALIDHCPKE
jgi:predicted ABC-type transport system involved in lysophospholipase L1 biosynthesis ATPase subunit